MYNVFCTQVILLVAWFYDNFLFSGSLDGLMQCFFNFPTKVNIENDNHILFKTNLKQISDMRNSADAVDVSASTIVRFCVKLMLDRRVRPKFCLFEKKISISKDCLHCLNSVQK